MMIWLQLPDFIATPWLHRVFNIIYDLCTDGCLQYSSLTESLVSFSSKNEGTDLGNIGLLFVANASLRDNFYKS